MTNIISIHELREKQEKNKTSRALDHGLIQKAKENVETEVASDHSADPIKDIKDIERIVEYLLDKQRYRDYMLFIVGINFGLRAGDLLSLRFQDIINSNMTFKDTFAVFEQKTRNTRRKKKNRYISVNDAVVEAITLYLENTEGISLSDHLFKSESNRGKNSDKPLTIKSLDRILKGIAEDLGLTMSVSTHTLRKTFCYHQMMMSNNEPRKLMLLQKMMNHSTPQQTLDYIGLTGEEMLEAYMGLNLGSKKSYYWLDTKLIEGTEQVV